MSTAAHSPRTRRDQIRYGDISEPNRFEWLASEVDDVEATLSDSVRALSVEMKALRRVLTGLLVSICLALIVVPVTVLLRT